MQNQQEGGDGCGDSRKGGHAAHEMLIDKEAQEVDSKGRKYVRRSGRE